MKRLLIALVGLFVLAACTWAEPLGTTTTSESSASSSTTTSLAPITTTTSSTTTTTVPPTTATTLLEGNWAEQPVITSANGFSTLGWWDGAEWVDVDQSTRIPVEGGEDFQVALLGVEGRSVEAIGTSVACGGIHGPEYDRPGVELDDPEALSFFTEDGSHGGAISGVAISAPWDIQPRPTTSGEWHPDLENVAIQLLADRGFTTDSVNHLQSVDADLDGDGSLESFFVIEEIRLVDGGSGVYSLLFMTAPSMESVHVLAESVIPPGDEGYPRSFRISAVADLNGDGAMEVVLDGAAWESSWVAVYEFVDGELVERIGAGCGV